MDEDRGKRGEPSDAAKWYELFSRGARDWLRHDEKVREAVRANLPEIIAGGDVINGGARTVRVPVRMLEHYHFRLRRPEEQQKQLLVPQHGSQFPRGSAGHEEQATHRLLLENRQHVSQTIEEPVITRQKNRPWRQFVPTLAPGQRILGRNHVVMLLQ